jgi:hypothetical protein
VILWAVALLLGGLQAFALKITWWKGVLAVVRPLMMRRRAHDRQ